MTYSREVRFASCQRNFIHDRHVIGGRIELKWLFGRYLNVKKCIYETQSLHTIKQESFLEWVMTSFSEWSQVILRIKHFLEFRKTTTLWSIEVLQVNIKRNEIGNVILNSIVKTSVLETMIYKCSFNTALSY